MSTFTVTDTTRKSPQKADPDPILAALHFLGVAWRLDFPPAEFDSAPEWVVRAAEPYRAEMRSLVDSLAGDPLEEADDLWRDVLLTAWPLDPFEPAGVFGTVRGLRLSGCGLERDEAGALVLLPPDGVTLNDLVEWLDQLGHTDAVRDVLRRAA